MTLFRSGFAYHGRMVLRYRPLPSDRDGLPLLSSRLRRLSTVLLLGLCGLALTGASLDPQSREWYRSRLRLSSAVSAQPPAKTDPLAEAIVPWEDRKSTRLNSSH